MAQVVSSDIEENKIEENSDHSRKALYSGEIIPAGNEFWLFYSL